MRLPVVVRYLGLLLLVASAVMMASAVVDLFYTRTAAVTLAVSSVLVACFGAFPMVFVPEVTRLSARESLTIAVGGWILLGASSALPYLLWGDPFNVVNALFESVSGLTTTGASILVRVEALPAGLLFWRSATHWMGGVGIIVLALSVLPEFPTTGLTLFRSEQSQVAPTAPSQRLSRIPRILLMVYCGLTVLETVALCAAGMPLFDAVTNSFGTIATGGFCPRDGSIAAYHSLPVEIIVMVFMALSGINFSFLYGLLVGQGRKMAGLTTTLVYLGGLVVGTLLVTLDLHGEVHESLGESLRYASFQILSVNTSTGFATADSSVWPGFSQAWIVVASLVGACAGSTSGAIKTDRIVLLFEQVRRQFRGMIRPRAVRVIFIDKRAVDDDQVAGAAVFIGAYLAVVGAATLLVALFGTPLCEAFTGTIACMGNIGPGLGTVGSLGHYAFLSGSSKLVLAAVMLIGRVEIFGLLLLVTPGFWREQ
jgi:trk system potassium uptake protein TrkH